LTRIAALRRSSAERLPTIRLRYIVCDSVKSVTIASRLALLAAALAFSACGRHGRGSEVAYVSAPQAVLRDRLATVYSKMGVVKNGDRVQVIEREKRFARVRTTEGAEGWIEQRSLVSQQVYDGFQRLQQQEQRTPVQSTGTTRNETNLHLEPGRETEHLYQLNQASKVSLLRRSTAERTLPGETPAKPAGDNRQAAPVLEDWWLIRDQQAHVGWVLGRMLDLDLPLEIAQYAEGQRIVAFFVLNQVTDADKQVPQYLVLLTESKDGLPFDFNQVRVFTWNVKRHRYETAYRERLEGVLPVTVAQENFDKEGTLPTFLVRAKDDEGNIAERKYKLNTPIVRRVLASGEQPAKPAAKKRRH